MHHNAQRWWLFGYGSLIATPELPEQVTDRALAWLPGFRRAFNKRSPGRGCPTHDSFDAFEIPRRFKRDGRTHSLAVGTVADPGSRLAGVALAYPADSETDVLADTDRREGYDADADHARLGYLRERVGLQIDDRDVTAWTYLSNPDGPYHLDPAATLTDRARILISATPRPRTQTAAEGRARGLGYVEQLRAGLHRLGVIDEHLEQLAAAILGQPGPWCDLVAPPRV